MKTSAMLFSGLLLAGCATSQKALVERYKDVTPTRFENAVAVVLEQRDVQTVDDQGEGAMEESFIRIKLLDRKAMDCTADNEDSPTCRISRAVCYNEAFDVIEQLEARTITPEGEVLAVDGKDFRDQTWVSWSIPEQGQRCKVYQVKGAAPGAIIEERYRKRSKSLLAVGGMWFGDRDPVIEATYVLDAPASYKLRWKTQNINIKPTEEQKGNRIVRTWSARDIQPLVLEEGMIAPDDLIPKLVVQNEYLSALKEFPTCRSIRTWEEFGACWNESIASKQEVTPIIQEVVDEIKKTTTTETEKVRAIWKFMTHNVRYLGLEKGLGGLIPLDAHVVCSKKYGDCKAVAGLISVLGRALGLKADPIIIGTRPQLGAVDLDMPGFVFNHSIARVEADSKVYFMDATGRDQSFDTSLDQNQGVHVVVGRPGAPFVDKTPVDAPERNLMEKKLVFEPAEDGAVKLQADVKLIGNWASTFRRLNNSYTPERWNNFVSESLSSVYPQIKNVALKFAGKEDCDAPYEINAKALIQRALQPSGRSVNFEVKDVLWSSRFIALFKPLKRRHPMDLQMTSLRRTRFEVQIPKGTAPVGLPKNISFEDPFFKAERLSQIEGDRVVTEYTAAIKELQIPADKYPEARKSFMKLLDASSFVLLFEPKQKSK